MLLSIFKNHSKKNNDLKKDFINKLAWSWLKEINKVKTIDVLVNIKIKVDNSGTTVNYDDFFWFGFSIYWTWTICLEFLASKNTGKSFSWQASTSLVHSNAAQ